MITYLKQKTPETVWGCDIECDSLTPSIIYCVVCRNLKTDEEKVFLTKEDFLAWRKDSPEVVFLGHNFISFDAPVLNKLWDARIDFDSCIDSLVLSYNYRPALEGGHSLEAWGQRLKFSKGDFNDFSKFSSEMLEYCRQDVRLTLKLYQALTDRMNQYGYSELSCRIEHQIRVILNKQQQTGFYFDRERASSFRDDLRQRQSDIAERIQKLFPPSLEIIKECSFRRLKDGSLPSRYVEARNKYPRVDLDESAGTYTVYDYEEFNLGSPKQRVERLLKLGWKPEKFTPTGFPKVDEDALVRFAEESGIPEVGALAEWLVLQGRASMLDTWFNNLGDDSRIHGKVITCGASTRRMTHNSPNTANIPSGAKARYGKECRSFWTVEPGLSLVLVGYDASGLETAGLCHYLNNSSATEALLRDKPNDIHTSNARRLTEALHREVDREWGAKTSWYAWLYGAYPPKLGEIVKGSAADGEIVIDTFFRNVPGLKELIEGVQREFKANGGRLKTIDGGYVWCPSLNAALNYLVQSMGSILMKLSSIILREEADKIGLWFRKVSDVHDESQCEVREEDADRFGKLAVWSIEEASRRLKMNVLVTGEYKIGKDWSETH